MRTPPGDDICSAGFLLLIIWLVGAKAVDGQPRLERRGRGLAIAVFAGSFLYCGLTARSEAVEDWLRAGVLALLIAGFTLGLSWIALAVLAAVHEHGVRRPLRTIARWRAGARRRREERDTRREAERRARAARAEYERGASERERVRLQSEADAKARSDARKRREDARAGCELVYGLHAPDIRERFPRAQLDEFLAKYMGDDRSPEEVEERGSQLRAIIRQHVERVVPVPRVVSIEDLARWYADQKGRIESLPVDGLQKRTHLAELNQRYAELTSKLLERMEP